MDTTNSFKLKQPSMISTSDTIDDVVDAVSYNAGVCEQQFITLGNVNTMLNGLVDIVIEEGQNTGGSLSGYIITKTGFVFQWGRVSVTPGAGVRVTFPKPSTITIGVNTNCTTGMYLTYTPKDLINGTGFNVATNSSNTEEIFWHSVGRM